MREPREKVIGGHTYQVTPLPAMRALKLMPLAMKPMAVMTSDEVERYAKELLAMARVDGKELLPILDLEMQGNITDLMELLHFAAEVSIWGPSDAVGHEDGATAKPGSP